MRRSAILISIFLVPFSTRAAEPIGVNISLPGDGMLLRANVPIFGSVRVPKSTKLRKWRLEYGAGPSPSEWTLIKEGTHPIERDPHEKGEVQWNPNKEEGGGGFEIARSVLKAIPGSKIPENASQGMARSDFIAQAQTALAAKDYETAIRAYLDHRRTYPNEATARQALLYAAALHLKLQQPQKAIALYDEAEIQYGTFSEGWKAALASAAILESQGNAKGAADKLKASLQKARTPEASAWYIASLAELAAKNKLPDEAAAYYAELLSKYPSQDAAKDALKSLRTSASQIKDWKKLARRLQDELSGTTLQLNKQELSTLRRLVLGLYVSNDDGRSAVT